MKNFVEYVTNNLFYIGHLIFLGCRNWGGQYEEEAGHVNINSYICWNIFFYVLLTVHLSIILAVGHLNAQSLVL